MSETEKAAIAAHLYVALRRKANRVIDVEWLIRNDEYAREMIKFARSQGQEDITRHADRLETLMFPGTSKQLGSQQVTAAEPEMDDVESEEALANNKSKYVGSLR